MIYLVNNSINKIYIKAKIDENSKIYFLNENNNWIELQFEIIQSFEKYSVITITINSNQKNGSYLYKVLNSDGIIQDFAQLKFIDETKTEYKEYDNTEDYIYFN